MKKKYKILIFVLLVILILFCSFHILIRIVACDNCCSGCSWCECNQKCEEILNTPVANFLDKLKIINNPCPDPFDYPPFLISTSSPNTNGN